MNYLLQIRAFYDWLITNPLPADAQALWHALMYINNKCAWQERFTVANTTLLSILGFSRPQLDRMRNLLIQVGRIEYEKRQGRQAGSYKIIPFVSHNETQIETQIVVEHYETQPEIQVETQPETQPETQTGHNQSTLNKLNKTKQNKNNNITPLNPPKTKPAKKRYGEFVELTEEEYERLLRDFGEDDLQWMIQRLDIYLGQSEKNRKKYTSHNHVLRGWVADRLREEKEKRGRLFAPSLKKERGEDIILFVLFSLV